MVQIQVVVPAGVVPGQQLLVNNPYGGQVAMVVPQGVTPGMALLVEVPMPVAQIHPTPQPAAPRPPPQAAAPPRPPPTAPTRSPTQPMPLPGLQYQPEARQQQSAKQREVAFQNLLRTNASRDAPPATAALSTPCFTLCSASTGGLSRLLPWTMVSSGTVQILERFGRFTKVAQPGLHWLNPLFCDCVAATLSTRLMQLETQCETKTQASARQGGALAPMRGLALWPPTRTLAPPLHLTCPLPPPAGQCLCVGAGGGAI